MKEFPFPEKECKKLYSYVCRNFKSPEGGTYNNRNRNYIGFFGHLKLMEAEICLYRATADKEYLDNFKKGLLFCKRQFKENIGIEDWWNADYTQSSEWIESNHLGIFAFLVYLYYLSTRDGSFNDLAEKAMLIIPKNKDNSGTFLDGFNLDKTILDDNRYLADHSEILAGFWALYKLTGKELYRTYYEDIFRFLDHNFKSIPKQPDVPAWLVGPKHITYGEGTKAIYCDESHTVYSQYFISRDIILTQSQERYNQLVTSTKWIKHYALFDDGLSGYNEKDDKLIGWSALYAAQTYWSYLITKEQEFYDDVIRTVESILFYIDKTPIETFIPVSSKINWGEMENNKAGLGEIWQLASILEGLSIPKVVFP
ncbi:AGE family epimerase/isomerase [bacterium]|nr:AGE family epimerase/isomerase [bacterium]